MSQIHGRARSPADEPAFVGILPSYRARVGEDAGTLVRLVFMPDFGADPLWRRLPPHREFVVVDLERLPLSGALKDDVRAWARRHDELQDPPGPLRGSEQDLTAWVATGRELLARLRAELAPHYEVVDGLEVVEYDVVDGDVIDDDVIDGHGVPARPTASPTSPASPLVDDSAQHLPARAQRPGTTQPFTPAEHQRLGAQIAAMSQELLWTVGDAVRRYGRHHSLTRQAIKTQHAVDALRAALEADLAQAHPQHFDPATYHPAGLDRGPYDRPR